jgi:hypothetical protein
VDGVLEMCVLVASLCAKSKPSRIGDTVVSTVSNEIKGHYDFEKKSVVAYLKIIAVFYILLDGIIGFR